MTSAGLDSVLTLAQRSLGVMQPRPISTLHVGGDITADGILKGGQLVCTGNASVGGSLTVAGNFTTTNLTVTNSASVGGATTLNGGVSNGRFVMMGPNASPISTTAASAGNFEIQPSGGGASMISFHRPGSYAAYFGLDTDNVWKIGGWSMGGAAYRVILGDSYQNAGSTYLAALSGPQIQCDVYYVGQGQGSYYINRTSNICQIANMNLLSWGWVGFNGNSGVNWSFNGNSLVGTHYVTAPQYVGTTQGYTYQCVDTNNSIYWDRSSLFQVASTGQIFRFYSTGNGRYFDLNMTDANHVTLGGTNTYIQSTRFDLNGYAAGVDHGRSGNEASLYTHSYLAGSCYVVLDLSATSVTQRSSRKIKAAIVPLDNDNAMARIRDPRSNPVAFQWTWDEWGKRERMQKPIDSPAPRNQQVGFVAEDMHYVVPEAVTYDTVTTLPTGINYGVLTSVLWAACRQLDARVQTLEAQLAA